MNKKITRRLMALVLVMCMVVGDFSGVYAAPAKTSKTTTVKASSVKLNKNLITLAKKKSYTLKATIAPKKATTKKLEWSSSNKKVATVNSKGKVVAKNYGTAVIKVKVKGTNKVAKCTVKVGTPVKSVKLNTKTLNMFTKQSKKLTATFTPKKVTVPGVTYTSSNKKVATVDKNGKVVAKKAGTAVITATAKDGTGKKAKVKVIVTQPVTKIKLAAAKSTLEIGDKTKVTAKIAPSNAKNKAVTFSSSNARVAKVDSKGNVTAVTEGTAVIKATAKDGSKKYGQVKITVRASLKGIAWDAKTLKISKINPGNPVNLGLIIKPDYAHIESIKYTSSNEKIAKVTKDGQLIGLSNGKVTIKAKVTDFYGNSKSIYLDNIEVYTPVKDVKINYEELDLFAGESKEIKAGVLPETASNQEVIFKSSNETVATVDENGVVKAVGEGIANITVYSKENNKISKVCHVTSKIPVEDINIEGKKDSLYESQQIQLNVTATNSNATDKTFTFSSSNKDVVNVDENGKVTAVKAGTADITVHANGARNLEKKFSISVKAIVGEVSWNEASAQLSTVEVNSQTQFGYVVKPADADVTSQYSSSNEEVAVADNTGLVTAKKNGKAVIKLVITDGAGNTKTLEKEIIVKTSVTGLNLSENEKTIYKDESDNEPAIYQIVYNVLPETASNTNVSFESDNVNVVTVNDSGVVTAVGPGTANITVKTQDGDKTAKIAITVATLKTKETASTSQEVENALKNKDLEVLTVKDATDVQIPEGSYNNVSLVINSPNGHIENYAQFKDVKINAVS